jgi:hypothetical protein
MIMSIGNPEENETFMSQVTLVTIDGDGASWIERCPNWSDNVPFGTSLSTSRLVSRLAGSGDVLVADRDIPNVTGSVGIRATRW